LGIPGVSGRQIGKQRAAVDRLEGARVQRIHIIGVQDSLVGLLLPAHVVLHFNQPLIGIVGVFGLLALGVGAMRDVTIAVVL